MTSRRLDYRPVTKGDLEALHTLVVDTHVRRYLMDGEVHPPEWTAARIADSEALFRRRGVGLWLAHDRQTGALAGFCGFLEIPSLYPEPQLVYALPERFGGRGLATEMARVMIAEARRQPGFGEIIAGVDEVNTASLRVLEKLGFERFASMPGAFGPVLLFRLTPGEGPPAAPPG